MNVVDSSAWLEYFANGPNAEFFSAAIETTSDLIVPSISIYEVFKRVLLQLNEGQALRAVAMMQQGQIVDLDAMLAMAAAKHSVELKLPMADSIMLATARSFDATLWTQDVDFEGLESVEYRAKR